jgi:hypothetical protein
VILLSVGLPGRLAQWCEGVMARLAGAVGGEVAAACWPAPGELYGYGEIPAVLDEIGRFLIHSRASHAVIGARFPDTGLCRTLAERQARFVLALDDPLDAVADLVADMAADPKLAARAVAKSCPLALQFDGLPGALAIDRDLARRDTKAAVAAIAAHFAIAVDADAVAAVAGDAAALGGDLAPMGEALAQRLPVTARKTVEGALAGYARRFRGGRLDQIVWSRDLFLLPSEPGANPIGPVEVAGGRRILVYGPYIQLPAGSWSAQIVLGFSPEATAATYLLDVYDDCAGAQLASTTFRPGGSGIHVADLTFSIAEPGGKGVEVRLTVTTEDAAGRLAFGRVVLQPLAMRQPDPLGEALDFASVLEL